MATKLYLKHYYRNNKERLLRYRRERYKKNYAYRKSIVQRRYLDALLKRSSRYPIVTHGTEIEPAYPIDFCTARSEWLLRQWVALGIIPTAIYYTKVGGAVYSVSQLRLIEWVVKTFTKNLTYHRLNEILSLGWALPFNNNTRKEIMQYVKETDAARKGQSDNNNTGRGEQDNKTESIPHQ